MNDVRKTQFARHRNAIREILLRDWDPIGVSEHRQAQHEYDGYIAGVYRILLDGASEARIVEHLHHEETVNMGLTAPDKPRLTVVAKKLRMLMDERA